MGFPPEVVDRMSLWEFDVCVKGVLRSKGQLTDPPQDISDATLADMGIEGFGDGD